jgi:hypothetical protein
MLQAADEQREAEDEQRVREHRPDERRAHDLDQPRAEREEADQQLGQVAERRLQHAGGARAESVAELLGRRADGGGEERQRTGRGDERPHFADAGVRGERGDAGGGGGAGEGAQLSFREAHHPVGQRGFDRGARSIRRSRYGGTVHVTTRPRYRGADAAAISRRATRRGASRRSRRP